MNDVQDDLYRRVRDAIASLPTYFRTETKIEGVNATDLHTLNTARSASAVSRRMFRRDFPRTFQDSTADEDAHAALARLNDRAGEDNTASLVAGSALAIVNAREIA